MADSDAAAHPQKRPRLTVPTVEAARTSTACKPCRGRKIKCSGNTPCRYCTKRGILCTFPESVKKKLYSVEYVEELKVRAAASVCRPGAFDSPDHSFSPPEDPRADTSGLSIPPPVTSRLQPSNANSGMASLVVVHEVSDPSRASSHTRANSPDAGRDSDDDENTLFPDTVTSSSLHFGDQIKSLHTKSPVNGQFSATTPDIEPTPADDVYNMAALKRQSRSGELKWPSLSEAHALLDTVLRSVGKLQHLFEPRALSDRLSMTYAQPPSPTHAKDMWYIELLMVFALGELLQGRLRSGVIFPGADFYLEAEKHLPEFSSLRENGIQSVEVIGMMTFFLQCADCRDDAYVYAGIALRLAIANGLARERGSRNIMRSEKSHRVRLWWTIYMQERRLAAATGNPLSIHDDAIGTCIPGDSPGFSTPGALNVNIKLARVTGETMGAIYGHRNRSVAYYLRSVKKILARLLEVAKSIPVEYAIDFSKHLVMSRTSATLHLMLYQGIILATRPTLLHVAKLRLEPGSRKSEHVDLPLFEKLLDTCIEAASRSLEVLQEMVEQRLIANFGFFDLDATFSAAFVFVLVEAFYPTPTRSVGVSGIPKASRIMQYLAAQGNRAAEKRRADLEQICNFLGITYPQDQDEGVPVGEESVCTTAVPEPEEGALSTHALSIDAAGQPEASATQDDSPQFDWAEAAATFFDQQPNMTIDQDMINNLSFAEGGHIPSSFYLDDFTLTGVIETDWEEFSKQLTS
ncbi:hypothetical protein BKA56DRAFT_641098 [Ilyonectria sp. MPI-CAGE-AT-0026]|nr:hypothetical protein BKA56DRAFT_641098 [Ilyonectria sp. MPI-CAGE-AT-0026]